MVLFSNCFLSAEEKEEKRRRERNAYLCVPWYDRLELMTTPTGLITHLPPWARVIATRHFWWKILYALRIGCIASLIPAILIVVDTTSVAFITNTFATTAALFSARETFGGSIHSTYEAAKAALFALPFATLLIGVGVYENAYAWGTVFMVMFVILSLLYDGLAKKIVLLCMNTTMMAQLRAYYDHQGPGIQLMFPTRLMADFSIGVAAGVLSTLLPYPQFASARVDRKLQAASEYFGICFAGICDTFWTTSNMQRRMNMVRIQIAQKKAMDELEDLQVCMFESHFEPQFLDTYYLRLGKFQLLSSFTPLVDSTLRVLEALGDDPFIINGSDQAAQFGQLLAEPIRLLSDAFEEALVFVSDVKTRSEMVIHHHHHHHDKAGKERENETAGKDNGPDAPDTPPPHPLVRLEIALRHLETAFARARRDIYFTVKECHDVVSNSAKQQLTNTTFTLNNASVIAANLNSGDPLSLRNSSFTTTTDANGPGLEVPRSSALAGYGSNPSSQEFGALMAFYIFSISQFAKKAIELPALVAQKRKGKTYFGVILEELMTPAVMTYMSFRNIAAVFVPARYFPNVLRMQRRTAARNMREALKFSLSMGIAELFFYYTDRHYAFWIGPQVLCFVASNTSSEAFTLGLMRLVGTMFGTVVGFFCARNTSNNVERTIALCCCITAFSFFRTGRQFGGAALYGSMVIIPMLTPTMTVNEAIARITQITFAVMIYAAIMMLFFPIKPLTELMVVRLQGLSVMAKSLSAVMKGFEVPSQAPKGPGSATASPPGDESHEGLETSANLESASDVLGRSHRNGFDDDNSAIADAAEAEAHEAHPHGRRGGQGGSAMSPSPSTVTPSNTDDRSKGRFFGGQSWMRSRASPGAHTTSPSPSTSPSHGSVLGARLKRDNAIVEGLAKSVLRVRDGGNEPFFDGTDNPRVAPSAVPDADEEISSESSSSSSSSSASSCPSSSAHTPAADASVFAAVVRRNVSDHPFGVAGRTPLSPSPKGPEFEDAEAEQDQPQAGKSQSKGKRSQKKSKKTSDVSRLPGQHVAGARGGFLQPETIAPPLSARQAAASPGAPAPADSSDQPPSALKAQSDGKASPVCRKTATVVIPEAKAETETPACVIATAMTTIRSLDMLIAIASRWMPLAETEPTITNALFPTTASKEFHVTMRRMRSLLELMAEALKTLRTERPDGPPSHFFVIAMDDLCPLAVNVAELFSSVVEMIEARLDPLVKQDEAVVQRIRDGELIDLSLRFEQECLELHYQKSVTMQQLIKLSRLVYLKQITKTLAANAAVSGAAPGPTGEGVSGGGGLMGGSNDNSDFVLASPDSGAVPTARAAPVVALPPTAFTGSDGNIASANMRHFANIHPEMNPSTVNCTNTSFVNANTSFANANGVLSPATSTGVSGNSFAGVRIGAAHGSTSSVSCGAFTDVPSPTPSEMLEVLRENGGRFPRPLSMWSDSELDFVSEMILKEFSEGIGGHAIAPKTRGHDTKKKHHHNGDACPRKLKMLLTNADAEGIHTFTFCLVMFSKEIKKLITTVELLHQHMLDAV